MVQRCILHDGIGEDNVTLTFDFVTFEIHSLRSAAAFSDDDKSAIAAFQSIV